MPTELMPDDMAGDEPKQGLPALADFAREHALVAARVAVLLVIECGLYAVWYATLVVIEGLDQWSKSHHVNERPLQFARCVGPWILVAYILVHQGHMLWRAIRLLNGGTSHVGNK